MTIEAPYSKYRKQNYLLITAILLGLAVLFAYDGYLSRYEWSMRHSFYQKHVTDNGGVPDSDIVFNQKSAPFLAIAGIAVAIYYFGFASKRKIVATDAELIANGTTLPYDSIEKIDKTHFDKKGFFILTYTDNGQEKELKLSDRAYDNMPAVLDHIVAKIS